VSKPTSRETNVRSIARTRLWAFATISFMCNVGDRSKDIVMHKSLVEAWTGRLLSLILRQVLVVSLPVLHLSMEMDNCYLRICIIVKNAISLNSAYNRECARRAVRKVILKTDGMV